MESSSETSPVQEEEKQRLSKGELLSSAKVVAGACQAALHHETDKIDKPKVAGAAADLLGASSEYGSLEGKSYGKYVGKAEDYLRKYEGKSEKPPEEGKKTEDEGESGGGGGLGGYMKVAQGLFKK